MCSDEDSDEYVHKPKFKKKSHPKPVFDPNWREKRFDPKQHVWNVDTRVFMRKFIKICVN